MKPFIKKCIEYFLNYEHPTSKYIKKHFASITFVIQFMYLLTRPVMSHHLRPPMVSDESSSETIDGHGNPIDGFSPGLWRFYFLVVDGSAPVTDGIKILWRVRLDPLGLFLHLFDLTKVTNDNLQPIGIIWNLTKVCCFFNVILSFRFWPQFTPA